MRSDIVLSRLGHTWLIDLDGCVFSHNGHLRGEDQLLPGVAEFWTSIPTNDTIILLTSRTEEHAEQTERSLERYALRYDRVVYGLPYGERIVINDAKPSGLVTASAIVLDRDRGMVDLNIRIDDEL